MSKGVSSAYSGTFSQNVPSVGSRLSGTVKPSYGKAKLIVRHSTENNLIRQDNTGQWIGGKIAGQPADLNPDPLVSEYHSPNHVSNRQRKREKAYRQFIALGGKRGANGVRAGHLANPKPNRVPKLVKVGQDARIAALRDKQPLTATVAQLTEPATSSWLNVARDGFTASRETRQTTVTDRRTRDNQ